MNSRETSSNTMDASNLPVGMQARRDQLFKRITGLEARQTERLLLDDSDLTLTKSIPMNTLTTALSKVFGLSKAQVQILLGVSGNPVSRLSFPSRDVLDRIWMLSGVFADVEAVLGEAGARRWLARPHPGLTGRTPVALLGTRLGERRVQDLIGAALDGAFL